MIGVPSRPALSSDLNINSSEHHLNMWKMEQNLCSFGIVEFVVSLGD